MNSIYFKGKKYEYLKPYEFIEKPELFIDSEIKQIKQSKYINIGSAFDTETSHIDEHHSIMYMWQFAIGDIYIIGREWFEFIELLDCLHDYLKLDANRKLFCFVHNLSYEWAFIRKHLQYAYDTKHQKNRVFATEERKIIYFETIQNVEFRDSLILTQRPLKALPSAYNLNCEKLTGEIDYNLKLTSKSALSDAYIAYGISDVKILVELFEKYVKREFLSKQIKCPLTSTGVVRDELKRTFKTQPEKIRKAHKNMMKKAFPNQKEYENLFKWVFRGGYVHSNIETVNETIVCSLSGSQDFKSSYPAVLLQYDYPERFCEKDSAFFDKIKYNRKYLKENAFYGTFVFKNICAKYPHSIESVNKLYKYDSKSLVADNGRLVKCDEITVCLTEQDWLNYVEWYDFESVKCISKLRVASKKPLPTWFKDLILKYFYLKETCDKDSIEYKLAKARLNSFYGMCVTSIINKSYTYENDVMTLTDDGTTFEKLASKEILLPFYGIWCTAYARRNLLRGAFLPFCKVGSSHQVYYGDTDSCKYENIIGNEYIFKSYNDRIERINKRMYVGKYDRSLFMNIGKFDFEHKYFKQKFLGAKRYMTTYTKYNKEKYELFTEVTVSGCVKGSLQQYCLENNLDIYEEFHDGMKLDTTHSHKLTSYYNDDAFSIDVCDEYGKTYNVNELSCVVLNDAPFSMTLTPEYLQLIFKLKEQNMKRIGDRIW